MFVFEIHVKSDKFPNELNVSSFCRGLMFARKKKDGEAFSFFRPEIVEECFFSFSGRKLSKKCIRENKLLYFFTGVPHFRRIRGVRYQYILHVHNFTMPI